MQCLKPSTLRPGGECKMAHNPVPISSVGAMSALGHKQTFAAQKVMSALPPKADMGATLLGPWQVHFLNQRRVIARRARAVHPSRYRPHLKC